jgi:hypothetical protein
MNEFGVQNIPVRDGNVDFNFVSHPPAPEPSIRSQLVNLGSTGKLGQTGKVNKTKLTITLGATGLTAYSAYLAREKSNRRLIESAITLVVGLFWSMS